MQMIKVIAKHVVKKEKIAEFKKFATELAVETWKEDGCISYQLYQDIENDKVMTFIEEWEDQEFLSRHMKSKHFLVIVPALDRMKEKESEVNIYQLVF
jgi:Uncharacterized conserved protein